jgi:predicted metal-dependent enzyme (double-stranded beta helix superfamily)
MTPFDRFHHRVRTLLEHDSDTQRCADGVARHLQALLDEGLTLDPEHREPGANEPRAHLVYVAPERNYSVVAFVWKPGQETSIHDHACWCVVGVVEGVEEETRYLLKSDGRERWLEPRGSERVETGHVCTLVPPEEDIHQVRNIGRGLAISLHVYGTDIGVRGTSINHRFDEPVVTDRVRSTASPRPTPWSAWGCEVTVASTAEPPSPPPNARSR